MDEVSSNSPQKMKVVLLAGAGILIVILLLTVVLSIGRKKGSPSAITSNKNVPITAEPSKSSSSTTRPPDVLFEKYVILNRKNVIIPPSLNSYVFKTSFSKKDVSIFAQQLGISNIQVSNTSYSGSNMDDPNYIGYFNFNSQTGSFEYYSYGAAKLGYSTEQTPQQQAVNFLAVLGVADATVTCPITYHKKGAVYQNVTFVECHRDWGKIGAPDLDPIGILNVPLIQSLSNVTLGNVTPDMPTDTSIVNVQGIFNGDGKARPTDFNTATVAITSDGRVVSAVSNIRWIQSSSPVVQARMKTPIQALNEFNNHKQDFILTIPDGRGSLDWEKVYQNNKAHADVANITDMVLTYTEKPQGINQTTLVPTYLIRGYATLDTGYVVRFVATVNATLPQSQARIISNQEVAGASTVQVSPTNTQLQLQTFTPGQPDLTQPVASSSSTMCTAADPLIGPNAESIDLKVPGYGDLIVFRWAHTFFLKSANLENGATVKQTFYKAVEMQYAINVAKYLVQSKSQLTNLKTVDDVKNIFSIMNGGTCTPVGTTTTSLSTPAPIYSCPNGTIFYGAGGYNEQIIETNATDVANQILDTIKNNTLESLAEHPDLFPKIAGFELILFIRTDRTFTDDACYISGSTPSLFISGFEGNVSINLPSQTSYMIPSGTNNTWNVTVHDGKIVSGPYNLDSLYYEYASKLVTFTPPTTGFITPTQNLVQTIRTIANSLALTNTETKQLVTESKNALFGSKKTAYIQISIADQDEINKLLPLQISPKPDYLQRIHLLLKPIEHPYSLPQPTLAHVRRDGYTVIEVGARSI